MSDAIAIIPARYASTRLPGKPLADIHGKPMIVHVMDAVAAVIDTYVATDDARIAAVVQAAGGKVTMIDEPVRRHRQPSVVIEEPVAEASAPKAKAKKKASKKDS